MKFLIVITLFLYGYSMLQANSEEYALDVKWKYARTKSKISENQWVQYQNYRKIQYGDFESSLRLDHGQFYFFDSALSSQIDQINHDLLGHNGESVFFWKTNNKFLIFNEWTLVPDDREMPLGLVKVRWVNENNNYDKFLTILTQDFACRPLEESNTCFKVDLMTDTPRKFVQRKYFDRLITWDITLVENGRYRLILKWQNGHVLSPVFNIQHSTMNSR